MEMSEKALSEQRSAMEQVAAERDSFRRQLEDIRTTVEYQEAKMEAEKPTLSSSSSSRNSSERRSLRRRRNRDNVVDGKSRGESVPPPSSNNSSRDSATPETKVKVGRLTSSWCV